MKGKVIDMGIFSKIGRAFRSVGKAIGRIFKRGASGAQPVQPVQPALVESVVEKAQYPDTYYHKVEEFNDVMDNLNKTFDWVSHKSKWDYQRGTDVEMVKSDAKRVMDAIDDSYNRFVTNGKMDKNLWGILVWRSLDALTFVGTELQQDLEDVVAAVYENSSGTKTKYREGVDRSAKQMERMNMIIHAVSLDGIDIDQQTKIIGKEYGV